MRDDKPRLGAACIIIADDCIVLGQRGRGPNKGKWVLPGGGVEVGETWQAAAEREVREETGLRVRVMNPHPVHVMQIFGPEKTSHRVCLVGVAALPEMAALTPCDELPALAWVPIGQLPYRDLSNPVRDCLVDMRLL